MKAVKAQASFLSYTHQKAHCDKGNCQPLFLSQHFSIPGLGHRSSVNTMILTLIGKTEKEVGVKPAACSVSYINSGLLLLAAAKMCWISTDFWRMARWLSAHLKNAGGRSVTLLLIPNKCVAGGRAPPALLTAASESSCVQADTLHIKYKKKNLWKRWSCNAKCDIWKCHLHSP